MRRKTRYQTAQNGSIKRDLQEYQWYQKKIQQLEDRLLELETRATKITTTLSDMPRGGGTRDKIGDVVAEIVAVQDKINEELVTSYKILDRIESMIASLPQREQFLMRARYLEGKSWEIICVEMNYEWAQVHRLHAEALKEVSV